MLPACLYLNEKNLVSIFLTELATADEHYKALDRELQAKILERDALRAKIPKLREKLRKLREGKNNK